MSLSSGSTKSVTTAELKSWWNPIQCEDAKKGETTEGFFFSARRVTRLGSHLHRLPSLLCVRQQLDGDGPTVLYGVLQIHEGVAHVTAHAALPADGHRAGLAEKQEHLEDTETEEGRVRLGLKVELIEAAATSESDRSKSLRSFEIQSVVNHRTTLIFQNQIHIPQFSRKNY